jgi:ferredoxin
MPVLSIDNRKVEVENGATILDAAKKLGIVIPTMCFLKDYEPATSCMVCIVEVEGLANFVPACATIAQEGMIVRSVSEQINQGRKAALELLLSDHLGDCLGPCEVTCPAHMNIPLMIRQIASGEMGDAIATVKKDIALPAVLGRICPKPCEKACRRADYDQAVSICLLKRYAADVDLQSAKPFEPTCKLRQNKRVAVVGAGPAGLAAAYYLAQEGFGCTIFDDHEKPGGMLQYAVPQEELGRDVLDAEIDLIMTLGVKFQGRTRIGDKVSLEDLQKDFDAVFVAIGRLDNDKNLEGLNTKADAIVIDNKTYQTSLPGVFAGGDAVRRRKLTVRAVADGKEAAESIAQYLTGKPVTGPVRPFNTRIGKLSSEQAKEFMHGHSESPRTNPSQGDGSLTDRQAVEESTRCLHCDCRKLQSCKLRQYAQAYGARPARYKAAASESDSQNSHIRSFIQLSDHPEIIFEPGKCIDCGLCVQIVARAGEELGLTFVGRGFDVIVAVPFNRSLAEAIKQTETAEMCVNACPTGALAFKDKPSNK